VWSTGEHSCTVHNEPKMLFKRAFQVLTKGLKNGRLCMVHASTRVLFTKCQKCLGVA
jgi:hypothetical protein